MLVAEGGRAEKEECDGGTPHAASRLLPVEGGAGHAPDCTEVAPLPPCAGTAVGLAE